MPSHRAFLLLLLLILSSSPAFAQPASHCAANEEVLWSCTSARKSFDVCASRDLGPSTGYLQYRAGPAGKPELVYPAQRTHPKGNFQFRLLPSGAQLSFTNGGWRYDLVEPLQGGASIWTAQAEGSPTRAVACAASSDTLTLNTTIERMRALGIAE